MGAVLDGPVDRLGHGELGDAHDAPDGPDRHVLRTRGAAGHSAGWLRDEDARRSRAMTRVLAWAAVQRVRRVVVLVEYVESRDAEDAVELGVVGDPGVGLRDDHAGAA